MISLLINGVDAAVLVISVLVILAIIYFSFIHGKVVNRKKNKKNDSCGKCNCHK